MRFDVLRSLLDFLKTIELESASLEPEGEDPAASVYIVGVSVCKYSSEQPYSRVSTQEL
jgi:hypothetical protein